MSKYLYSWIKLKKKVWSKQHLDIIKNKDLKPKRVSSSKGLYLLPFQPLTARDHKPKMVMSTYDQAYTPSNISDNKSERQTVKSINEDLRNLNIQISEKSKMINLYLEQIQEYDSENTQLWEEYYNILQSKLINCEEPPEEEPPVHQCLLEVRPDFVDRLKPDWMPELIGLISDSSFCDMDVADEF